ncbi:DNA-3-methyladenine glycosylase II [Tepidamorphus gemmatus]|uniref:DNA-3-methyladenine glycosylase II n=2 Tax=Tepidamorphus gemmatus TaxID=747076 RepID=A0A4R3MEV4_9HYPH|nr:DNA-3-methyladenine glycosylase II [Tepidamorphus gemmatus]
MLQAMQAPRPERLDTPGALEAALDALADRDDLIARLRAAVDPPVLRRYPAGLAGLARIVVGQQVSTASAEAIWTRLSAQVDPLDPAAWRQTGEAALRAAGLSRPKIGTLMALADAIASGGLDLGRLDRLDAETARAELCRIRGIGPWTAEVYLMFCLGHADSWPAGDVALQHAAAVAIGLPGRPDARALARLGERWRPWRSAAAHLLWAYYRALRGRAGVSA